MFSCSSLIRNFPLPLIIGFAGLMCIPLQAKAQNLSVASQNSFLPVGVAAVDITPDRPIRLSGYGSRKEPSEGIAQQLHAKALAIGNDNQLSVLVTVDSIGVPAWVSNELSARLNRKVSLPRARLVVASSHTHAAPALYGTLPYIFVSGLTESEQEEIKRYTNRLLDKLEEVALGAIVNRAPARLAWTKGSVGFAGNRRVLENGKWQGFGTQADGPVDHSLPLLAVYSPEGEIRSVFANYACHCTTLGGGFNQIHGDWASVAQEEIESRHPNAIALIAIGCGADQNPNPRGELNNAVAHGVTIADEVDRLLAKGNLKPLSETPRGIYREIELPLDPPPSREEFQQQLEDNVKGGHFPRAMLERLDRGEQLDSFVTYPIQTWRFGDELAMVFLAGEVVVDYAHRFYREYDASRLWVNAYCNDVPCYIPSRRIYSEGGYEVDGSMLYYGKPSRLSVDTEDRIAGEVMKQMPRSFLSDDTRTLLPDPVEKDAALETIVVAEDLEVQLVAAEPLVMDPIDIAWGSDGKLWVVEMADYPEGIDGKHGGRVRFLEDDDNDGYFDRSTLFLDGLHYPNSVMPWREGVLVATATEVFLATDTNKDGKADKKEIILRGFESGNPQHQLAGLQWGLDNWIHVANDFSKGAITSVKTGETINLGTRDLRFNPDTGEIDPKSGRTQYGLIRDDWGNWFGCSNSYPWWHYALEDRYLRRNPYVVFPSPKELLGDEKRAGPVYPASHTPSRFNDYDAANRFTSACSVTPYRDELLGSLAKSSLFVAEPVHNLVSRLVIDPSGSSFTGTRAASERASEFFASTDNWSRPTSIRLGPDGALYIVDMYRQVIEHPEWIPERLQWRHNLRSGSDKGRIYRLGPKGSPIGTMPNFKAYSNTKLFEALDTVNGTQRDLIHQELIWQNATSETDQLKRLFADSSLAEVRVQILSILDGMEALDEQFIISALSDSHQGVRRNAIRLSEPFLTNGSSALAQKLHSLIEDPDPFVRKQLAYSLGESTHKETPAILADLMTLSSNDKYTQSAILSSAVDHHAGIATHLDDRLTHLPENLLSGIIKTSIGAGSKDEIAQLLTILAKSNSLDPSQKSIQLKSLALALSELDKRGHSLESLETNTELSSVRALIAAAKSNAMDFDAPTGERIAGIGFFGLARHGQSTEPAQLVGLLNARNPTEIQQAAIQKSVSMGDPSIGKQLLANWDNLSATIRSVALQGFVSRNSWIELLLAEIPSNPSLARSISPAQRASLVNHGNPAIRRKATSLFTSQGSSSRQSVINSFESSLILDGNFRRGAQQFETLCATCHQVGDVGFHVGPDLSALSNKSRESLLKAIIDPNSAIESSYALHIANTKDGRSLAGVIASETASSISLLNAGGLSETVMRSDLESLSNTGSSLMPAGLEASLDNQSMADLLVFLQQSGVQSGLTVSGDGSLRLGAEDAQPTGQSVQFDPNLESLSWIAAGDTIEWRVDHLPAGDYTVFFNSGLETSSEPTSSSFKLYFGDQVMHGTISNTTRLFRMRKREYGAVTIPYDLNNATIRFQHDLPQGQVSIQEIAIIPIR